MQLSDDSGLTGRLVDSVLTFTAMHIQGNYEEDINKQYINK